MPEQQKSETIRAATGCPPEGGKPDRMITNQGNVDKGKENCRGNYLASDVLSMFGPMVIYRVDKSAVIRVWQHDLLTKRTGENEERRAERQVIRVIGPKP